MRRTVFDEVKSHLYAVAPTCTPDTIDRTGAAGRNRGIADLLRERIPNMSGTFLRASTCMYTNTPMSISSCQTTRCDKTRSVHRVFRARFQFVRWWRDLADLAIEGSTVNPIGLFDPADFSYRIGPASPRAADDPHD